MRRVSMRGECFTRQEERVDISNHQKTIALLEKLKHAIDEVQNGKNYIPYLKAINLLLPYK